MEGRVGVGVKELLGLDPCVIRVVEFCVKSIWSQGFQFFHPKVFMQFQDIAFVWEVALY